MRYFVVEQRDLWGDYGDVLIGGYASRDSEGNLLLKRTGPFLPPISFPLLNTGGSRIVVNDELKKVLEQKGASFRPTVKHHIVKQDWESWNRKAKDPAVFPRGGEPENYIWGKKHNADIAKEMVDAWEVILPVRVWGVLQSEAADGSYLDQFEAKAPPPIEGGAFHNNDKDYAVMIVDQPTRDLLAQKCGEWIKFCEIVSLPNNRAGGDKEN